MRKSFHKFNRTFLAATALLLASLFTIQSAVAADATSIKLAWDQNPETSLTGYNVYRSTQSGAFSAAALNGATKLTTPAFTDVTAQSGATYYYRVTAVGASGQESTASAQVQAVVAGGAPSANMPPLVNAGADRALVLPASTMLTATASDDGLPRGLITSQWSVVNGAGVTFANANTASTTATFAAAGVYTLRVTASDGQFSAADDVVVSVKAATVALAAPAGLTTLCSPDGKTFTTSWNAVAGATKYYLRVDYTANNANGLWIMDANDFYIDDYTKTSFTGAVTAGKPYTWWIHGATATEVGPPTKTAFTCSDTTAPVVSITAPAAGAVISTSSVTVSAAASDNVGVVGVQFKLNGVNLQAEDTTAPYSILWNTATVKGANTLLAISRDAAGNQTTSAPIAVTVHQALVAPTGLTTLCSADGKTFTTSWNAVAGATKYYLRVDYTANNANGLWVMDANDYYIDENLTETSFTGNVITGKPYTWWIHGGNTEVGPPSKSTFTCSDKTAPVVSITAPTAGAVIAPASITISAAASDNLAVTGVQFKLNGVNLQAEDTTAPYAITWDATKAKGAYTLLAIARDAAGNQTTSTAAAVTVGKAPLVKPDGLLTMCNADGKTFTTSWNAVAGATKYYLRVDYTPNNANGLWVMNAADFYIDDYTRTSFTGSVIGNKPYTWWIHGATATEVGPPSKSSFTCSGKPSTAAVKASLLKTADEAPVVGYAVAATANDLALITLNSSDAVVSEVAAQAVTPVREGRLYVRFDGPVNTSLAIANDEMEAAVIAFNFTDGKGVDFAHGSFTLEAKHSLSAFVNQAPFNLPTSMEGTLTFKSSTPVGVTALHGFTNQRGEFLMTPLPVGATGKTADAASAIVIPQFSDGGGWSTQVVLTNPTDAAIDGTLQFFSPSSSKTSALPLKMTVNGVLDSTFKYTIAPRSASRFTTANAGADLHVGYVLATASANTAAPQGLSILSFSNQNVTVSEAGIAAVAAGTSFHTAVQTQGALHSGLAIANPSAKAVRATLELIAADGSATGMTASLDIPAKGHVAQFVNELFPTLADGFAGTLRIRSTDPIAVTGLRIRTAAQGDLVLTAIPAINDASSVDGAKRLFPLVINGGGYSTILK